MKDDDKITLDKADLYVYLVSMFAAGFTLGLVLFTWLVMNWGSVNQESPRVKDVTTWEF